MPERARGRGWRLGAALTGALLVSAGAARAQVVPPPDSLAADTAVIDSVIIQPPADSVQPVPQLIEFGAPADLMLFDPERGWKFEADLLLSKSKNSPFDGRPLQGRVFRTVVDGRTVFHREPAA